MNRRFSTRVLTALLLLLATIGLPGTTGCATLRATQCVVWARAEKRRNVSRESEDRQPAVFARRIMSFAKAIGELPLPVCIIERWLFQRPPPTRLLLHA
jgi:hypothetical protein